MNSEQQQQIGVQQHHQDHLLGTGISSEALLRLFEILPVEFCTQIWTDMSDDNGSHARSVLQHCAKQRPELAPVMWPRLQRYLEHLVKTERGCRELLDMHVSDHFLDLCYLAKAIRSELNPRDSRLVVHYARDAVQFSQLRITAVALVSFDRDSTDKLKELIFLCGQSLAVIQVEEGIVPELLDVIHRALPSHQRQQVCYRCPSVSFGEMLRMARWWQETRDIRVIVEATGGERWAPKRPSGWYDIGSSPLRRRTSFSYTDAAWIVAEAERRKAARRHTTVMCPACGLHDPMARHMRNGEGYMCTKQRQQTATQPAKAGAGAIKQRSVKNDQGRVPGQEGTTNRRRGIDDIFCCPI